MVSEMDDYVLTVFLPWIN